MTPHEDAEDVGNVDEEFEGFEEVVEFELKVSGFGGFSRASAVSLALLHASSPVATEHVAVTRTSQSNSADGEAPMNCTKSFCSTRPRLCLF